MVAEEELLKDEAIRAYLMRLIGENGLTLIEKFPPGGEFSDEELAENTGINLNSVRHSLYTLYEKRLAEYRRIKNAETGWLTYLWTLKLDRIEDTIAEDMQDILEILESREKYEDQNDFYICKNCGVVYTFDDAFSRGFVCPPCETKMEHFDNDLIVQALKKRIKALRDSLGVAE